MSLTKNFLLFLSVIFTFLSACQSSSASHSQLEEMNELGLIRESVQQFKKEVRKNPNDTKTHHLYGQALVQARQYHTAVKHLEFGTPQERENFHATFYLAEAYRGQQKFAQAIFYYNKALTFRPKDINALTALSWSYFRVRYYSESLATSTRLLKIDEENTEGSIILARTYIKLSQLDKAENVIKSAKKFTEPSMFPFLNSVLGEVYFQKSEYSKSIKAFRKALRKEPMLAGALYGLGRCLAAKGRPNAAAHYMAEALKIRPAYSEVHFQLGRILEQKDPQKSILHYESFKRMAHSDPEHLQSVQIASKRIQHLKAKQSSYK